MPTHKRTGHFKTIDDKISECSCQWNELTPSQRTKRALQILGIFWAAAVISVLIPILHFVLVPGLFIGGIVAAFIVYKQTVLLLGVHGPCPQCQTPQNFKKLVFKPEMKELCTNCHTTYRIEFANP